MSRAGSAISGPRQTGTPLPRRLVSRAMAGSLSAFVVPDERISRARGLDLRAAGLQTVSTPRHASVLVVVGWLPDGLAKAATVAYAQMPRPRAVLSIGDTVPGLPADSDASSGLDQESLQSAVTGLCRRFAEGAFDTQAEPYEAAVLESKTEYVCPMHPEVVQDEPGECPKCGMDLVAREAGSEEPEHSEHDHSGPEEQEPAEDGGGEESGGNDSDPQELDHPDPMLGPVAGEDFMSMVEMTRGTPRSSDGLQMEWVRTPFGPLFPGLPGGLGLTFTLDGDTVARVEAGSVTGGRAGEYLAGPLCSLEDRAARLDPLSPVSYRLLARRATEGEGHPGTESVWIGALERERAASHLGWLADFGQVIGYAWLSRRAGELQLAVRKAAGDEIRSLRNEAQRLARRVERTPLLRRKLSRIGVSDEPYALDHASGPVVRADGVRSDARIGDESYTALGFEPVLREGNDALSRLRVRLAEIQQSLTLAESVRSADRREARGPDHAADGRLSGSAGVETPRGTATLTVEAEGGKVVSAELKTPSDELIGIVESVTLQREVADALVGVASLDLSPWDMTRGVSG